MMSTSAVSMLEELRQKHNEALERLQEWDDKIQALPPDAKQEEVDFLKDAFAKTNDEVRRWAESVERQQVIANARQAVKPQDDDTPEGDSKRPRLVVDEPMTYRKRGPHNFFDDVVKAKIDGDDAAQARLARHATELRVEKRDLTSATTAGGEFIAPTYLQDEWIRLARAGRVTANLVTNRELPPGQNSINMPRLSTGAATAIQTADNAAVQETDPATNLYTFGVKTIAGQVDLSRQLFDLSQPGMDEVIRDDLAADYATKLDIQVISGTGLSGQALGITKVTNIGAVTYTDASPTVGELYPKIADAWSRVGAAIYRPADAIVMHPRRWAMFAGAVDSTGRPLVSAETPSNAIARNGEIVAEGLAGSMMGLPVYIDPNIPTNLGTNTREDIILVMRTAELYLYERGEPFVRVFEDIGSGTLTVRISLWNYFAFGAGRYPGAITTVGGTGMDPPTF